MKIILKWMFIIFIVLFLSIVYARYIGTMGFDTKEYTIYDKNIPDGFDGIKIIHFSDLHYNRAITLSKIEKIVEEINLINPDEHKCPLIDLPPGRRTLAIKMSAPSCSFDNSGK